MRDGRRIIGDAVAAIALGGVFQAGVGVAFAAAVVDAGLDVHGAEGFRRGGQGAAADGVGAAADVLVSQAARHVGEVLLKGADGGVVAGQDGGLAGSVGDGVAAGEGVEDAIDLLGHGGRDDASLALLGGEEFENRAVGDEAAVVGAFVDGSLEEIDVPAVDEIAVHSVAGWVTHGEDERLARAVPHVCELVGVVKDLEKEGDEVDGVGSRAWTAVVGPALRVRHVGLVIGRVEVDAVPAGGEEDLSAETIGAVLGGEAGGLRGGSRVVEADKGDGSRGKVRGGVALEWITSQHAETLGESLESVVVGARTLEVVGSHATEDTDAIADVGDLLKGSVLVLVVERGGPVVGKILLDGAGGAGRSASLLIGHVKSEAIATGDGVDVAADLARGNNGIGTLVHDTACTGDSEKGRGGCGKSGDQAECDGAGSVHVVGSGRAS